jgi:hypothetical protein
MRSVTDVSRKNKEMSATFSGAFAWSGLIYAAADVYNGVSDMSRCY